MTEEDSDEESLIGTPDQETFVAMFNIAKQLGFEYTKEETIREVDDTNGRVSAKKTTEQLKLDNNTFLILLTDKHYETSDEDNNSIFREFYIERNLPKGTKIQYRRNNTMITSGDGETGYCLSLEDGRLLFDVCHHHTEEEMEESRFFTDPKKVGSGRKREDLFNRYSVEYTYIDLIPIELYKIISDQTILNYFSFNNLVVKVSDEQPSDPNLPPNLQGFFNLMKALGYVYSEEVYIEDPINFDPTETSQILRLSQDLSLLLVTSETGLHMQFKRRLPGGLILTYWDDIVVMYVDGCRGTRISIENGLLLFYMDDAEIEDLKEIEALKEMEAFKELTMIKSGDGWCGKYSTKYDHLHLIPFRACDYIKDKRVLDYFKENKLVVKDDSYKPQFMNLEIEVV